MAVFIVGGTVADAQVPSGVRERAHRSLVKEVDQSLLAQQLTTGSAAERARALAVAEELGPSDTQAILRSALVAALVKGGRAVRERDLAIKGGTFLPEREDPEFVARVAGVVASLGDRESIIPLVDYGLGTGLPAIRALAGFGEDAAAAVLRLVMSPDAQHDAVDSGLIALRMMVEQKERRPISGSTLARVKAAAAHHLASGEGLLITTLWWAIDLASALDDPGLRNVVARLATDLNAMGDRRVLDPRLIEQTQRRAADRLAGKPATPVAAGR